MSLPVLVINRDRDRERWDRTRAAARAQGVEPIRIPALDAHAPGFPFHRYAGLIGPTFWGRETIKPGAIGCFLSHRAAWSRVIEEGWPAALILEDDADLTEPPDRAAAALAGARCDLLFANQRMAGWITASGLSGDVVALDRLVAALAPLGGPAAAGQTRTPGSDAYVLTREGARRLLAITQRTRIRCGVDWAKVRAALPRGVPVAGIGELERLEPILPRLRRPIAAGALARPVAAMRKVPSVLKHSVEVPIRDLISTVTDFDQ